MAIIKELQRTIDEKQEEQKLIDDKMLQFINKGGSSTESIKEETVKKSSHRARLLDHERFTLRMPKKLIVKINKKRLDDDSPLSMNHWIVRQLQRLVEDY